MRGSTMQNGIYKSKGYVISKIGTEFGLPVKTSMRLPRLILEC